MAEAEHDNTAQLSSRTVKSRQRQCARIGGTALHVEQVGDANPALRHKLGVGSNTCAPKRNISATYNVTFARAH